MFLEFNRYFLRYIFLGKTKQKILFLAMGGLLVSSFALLVLQSIMGGLQTNMVKRSHGVEGRAVISFQDTSLPSVNKVHQYLQDKQLAHLVEYEIELLMRKGGQIAPVVVHGIDLNKIDVDLLKKQNYGKLPPFIHHLSPKGSLIGEDLSYKVRAFLDESVSLISPSHTNSLLGDVPRQVEMNISGFVSSGVPEVDATSVWTRISLVQNLIRARVANRIRLFVEADFKLLESNLKKLFPGVIKSVTTWETKNADLVYALKLEAVVMNFLFVAMTFLVAIAIMSGFLIFFGKIKIDLISFWILGSSEKKLDRLSGRFIYLLNFIVCSLGLGLGLFFLYLLDNHAPDLMPDIFVESRIPVNITWQGVLISLLIPYFISICFSFLSLKLYRLADENYLTVIRSTG